MATTTIRNRRISADHEGGSLYAALINGQEVGQYKSVWNPETNEFDMTLPSGMVVHSHAEALAWMEDQD